MDRCLQHDDDLRDVHAVRASEVEQQQHQINLVFHELRVVDEVLGRGLTQLRQEDNRSQELKYVDDLSVPCLGVGLVRLK